MSELGARARVVLEKAYVDEIGAHFHGMFSRLSGDEFSLANLTTFGDQFELGLRAVKAAREIALARSDKVFQ